MGKSSGAEKIARGRAGELRVASELCRRGYCATVTMGNTPNVDVLCSNSDWTKTIFIQVKTFRAGAKDCQVGKSAEKDFGKRYFWILVGLHDNNETVAEEFYIIPSANMAKNMQLKHELVKKVLKYKDSGIRKVRFGNIGKKDKFTYCVQGFKNRWDLIEDTLRR